MNQATMILILSMIAVLGAAGYLLLGRSEVNSVAGSAPATQAELTFLGLAARLDSIVFDASVANDPRFLALQDIGVAVVSENAGRVDPFAPLGR